MFFSSKNMTNKMLLHRNTEFLVEQAPQAVALLLSSSAHPSVQPFPTFSKCGKGCLRVVKGVKGDSRWLWVLFSVLTLIIYKLGLSSAKLIWGCLIIIFYWGCITKMFWYIKAFSQIHLFWGHFLRMSYSIEVNFIWSCLPLKKFSTDWGCPPLRASSSKVILN